MSLNRTFNTCWKMSAAKIIFSIKHPRILKYFLKFLCYCEICSSRFVFLLQISKRSYDCCVKLRQFNSLGLFKYMVWPNNAINKSFETTIKSNLLFHSSAIYTLNWNFDSFTLNPLLNVGIYKLMRLTILCDIYRKVTWIYWLNFHCP